MAPQRFASVRQKSRQTVRLSSLRDDTGLVALRYEQTKQAEPPIPLPPPRNPRRVARPDSILPPSPLGSPLVIAPPPVPPPQEEHPLFRRQTTDGQKRDSGLTPASSSVTIKEECEHCEDPLGYEKVPGDISDASSIYSSDGLDASPNVNRSFDCPYPAPLRVSDVHRRPKTPEYAAELVEPASPRPSSLTQKLGKSFSLRSVGKKRLRKKNPQLDDKVASGDAASPVMRGSPKFPDSPKLTSRAQTDKGRDAILLPSTDNEFTPISTPIPKHSLWDELGNLSFSKRGSIMFGGRTDPLAASFMTKPVDQTPGSSSSAATSESAGGMPGPHNGHGAQEAPVASTNDGSQPVPSIQVVPMDDVERESQKVRSLYESGDTLNWQDGGRVSFSERLEPTEEVPSDEEENVAYGFPCFSMAKRSVDANSWSSSPLQFFFGRLTRPSWRPRAQSYSYPYDSYATFGQFLLTTR